MSRKNFILIFLNTRLLNPGPATVTFSGHVAALDPSMWYSRALLWTQSSRQRLGQVMAWSHTQHFYHATKR
jgi:hypothetical protein